MVQRATGQRLPLRIRHFLTVVAGLSIALLTANPLGAQAISDRPSHSLLIKQWTTADGLPTMSLLDVVQTRDGFLWIASFDGLARFDGREFKLYDRQAIERLSADGRPLGLRGNGFQVLAEDSDGNLWIGTQGSGVLIHRDGRYRRLNHDSVADHSVRNLQLGSDGEALIATIDSGAFRYDGDLHRIELPSGAKANVQDIIAARNGGVWLAVEGTGLVRRRPSSLTTYTTADGLVSNAVTSLLEDDRGLWIGTEDGLDHFKDGRFQAVAGSAGLEIDRLEKTDRGLWLLTSQGLYLLKNGASTVERMLNSGAHPVGAVSGLTVDREGSVWLASYGEGLYQVRAAKFSRYRRSDGLASDRVSSVAEIDDGRLLLGADDGTAQVLTDDGISDFPLRTRLPKVRIRHSLRDRQGTLWISTYAGLLRKTPDEEVLLTKKNGLPTNQVRRVYEDSRSEIWVATRNAGLLRIDPNGAIDSVGQKDGLASDFVFSIEEDGKGSLVVGTYDGVGIFDPQAGTIRNYTTEDGLPGGLVFNTHLATDGALWLATNGGLARLEDGAVTRVTGDQGLPAESIFDLVEDELGYAWLSSSKGVIRVSMKELSEVAVGKRERLEPEVFDEDDGLAHRECTGATSILVSTLR